MFYGGILRAAWTLSILSTLDNSCYTNETVRKPSQLQLILNKKVIITINGKEAIPTLIEPIILYNHIDTHLWCNTGVGDH